MKTIGSLVIALILSAGFSVQADQENNGDGKAPETKIVSILDDAERFKGGEECDQFTTAHETWRATDAIVIKELDCEDGEFYVVLTSQGEGLVRKEDVEEKD